VQQLASASPEALEAHLTGLARAVSNVRAMGKDGRRYRYLKQEAAWAQEQSAGCIS
jgi:hypothetical protein